MALTNKQRAFVEYLLGESQWNASDAARKAGYKHETVAGSRLLANDNIRALIEARLRSMGATAEALVGRWMKRIEADISPFVDKNGLDVKELKEAGLGFLIRGVRKTKDATTILLRDPDKAEEMLAKHLGMFVEKRELSGKARIIVEYDEPRSDRPPADAARQANPSLATSGEAEDSPGR